MTFRRRLAVLTASAVALTAVAGAGAVYLVVRHQLYGQVHRELRQVAAVHSAGSVGLGRLRNPVAFRPPRLPRVISADGRILAARFPELSYPVTAQATAVAAGRRASVFEAVHFGSEHVEIYTVQNGPGRAFQVAQSLESVDGTLHRLFVALLIVAGAGVLFAPVAGQAVAGGALRPVRRLTRAAAEIARTGDIDTRVEVRGRDELASLSGSFNSVLDRLAEMIEAVERARRSQRQLVADASHELRTPLTSLRANVELLALDSRTTDRTALAADVVDQLDALTTLVTQLIELAREELREPELTPLRLDEIVREAVERMRLNYPHVEFDADVEPTTVRGSRDSLSRAVSNLVDNAAKWSPDGAVVDVALHEGTIRVRDRGPGIDEADLPHVFERFYRGAASRDRPGSGLGLAIVSQVVSAHGGQVRAERADGGGTVFVASLPVDHARDS